MIFKRKFLLRSIVELIVFALLIALLAVIQLVMPLKYTQQIVILTYHRVSDNMPNPWDSRETVTPQQFREHLAFLKDHGFHVMALNDALTTLQDPQKAITPNSVVLTFDDGDRTYAENAVPILRDFQYPSTEFIIGKASLFSKKDYLSWPEIRDLAKDPLITLHSHTFNAHATIQAEGKTYFATDPLYLPREHQMESPSDYQRRILHDFKQEQDLFQKYLGRNDNVIALPYGHAAKSFISLAQESGYSYVLTQDRTQANYHKVDPTHIFRLDVGNRITDTSRLSLLLKGLTSSGPLHGIFWLKVKYNQILFDFSPRF
ncbi:polysaccharide deacetylase family protein [Desulfosporosinus metallidurans]|uniref:Polysaccharide deacetylase family protein n=1 Tax=Desulfosporosinus metallidurans TaxID=1888891 RepID=A0A1Q8QXA1_9FIRM|nr:polysaccharide deacetylase family protein [Desulfosporosinus metallidurans]OLN31925.1 Polysaccharide deacetylase family protein [Desulfosporosinus metallidurans]